MSRDFRIPSSKEGSIKCDVKNAILNADLDYAFTLFKSVENARAIQLLSYNIEWKWPNLYSSTNTLIMNEGGSNITVTLPTGNYFDTDIITDLGEAMTNASTVGNVYTITENSVTSKFIITASVHSFSLIYAGSTMSSLIGLSGNISSTHISNTYVVTLQNTWNLLPSKELDISLPNLVTMWNTDGTNNSIAGTVSLSSYAYGDTIRENLSGVELALNQKNFNQFVISITDQDGYCPQFAPDALITFTFRILFY